MMPNQIKTKHISNKPSMEIREVGRSLSSRCPNTDNYCTYTGDARFIKSVYPTVGIQCL